MIRSTTPRENLTLFESTMITYKGKSCYLSVRLSVRTFLVEWISAISAQINVKLAQNKAPVFWDDKEKFQIGRE